MNTVPPSSEGPLSAETLHLVRADLRFLLQELFSRGASAYLLDFKRGMVEVTLAGRRELLMDIDSSIVSASSSAIASLKPVAKKLLQQAEIQTPFGEVFDFERRYEAIGYAESIGFPCVLKPCFGVKGEGVTTDIEDAVELDSAIEEFYLAWGNQEFLIEKQFLGEETRVFITRDGWYAALHREPAFVTGDGVSSIESLIQKENNYRTRPDRNALCPISLDPILVRYLKKQNLSLGSIPADGEKIRLRGNSNLGTGGYCRDATDTLHPSVVEICASVLKQFPGLPYAGIDFMSKDCTAQQNSQSYVVLEVNCMPSIAMHMGPAEGKRRNTAQVLADLVFPELKCLPEIDMPTPIAVLP